jgi:hypothetical protein
LVSGTNRHHSPWAERPKRRSGERGPGVKTLLTKAALDAAAADPDIEPLAFLRGVYRDPTVDPRLRLDAAKAAAPYCHPKPTGAPTDPGAGAMVIDGMSVADRARIDARLARLGDLDLKDLLGDDLSPDEQAELERLHAWADTLPPHVLGLDADDIEMRRLLAEDDIPAEPSRQRTYEDPAEQRKRLEAEQRAPIDVKATTPVNEPVDDREVPPEPVDDDSDDDGQN